MDPDFVMNKTSDMGRGLLFAFSQHEVEEENKAAKKNKRNSHKRGGR